MAIDTIVMAASLPIGAYTVGQIIPMNVVRGPKVVRDGNGAATLKRFVAVESNSPGVAVNPNVHIKNAQWNDEVIMPARGLTANVFAKGSPAIHNGGNVPLVPNSSFDGYVEIQTAGTTTAATDVLLFIDIEYSAIPAINNPAEQDGYPVTIEYKDPAVPAIAPGSIAASGLPMKKTSVDVFKAGYTYLLSEMFVDSTAAPAMLGFISITGAANQGGLERLIPFMADATYEMLPLMYSTPLVKGPMDINLAVMGSAAVLLDVQMDFVKR